MKPEIPKQFQRIEKRRGTKIVEINGKRKVVYDGSGSEVIHDARLDYPAGPSAILEQLQNVYSCVFIALHPFIQLDGLNPENSQLGSLVFNRSDIEGDLTLEVLNKLQEEHAKGRSYDFNTFKKFEKLVGKRRKWSDVGNAAGLTRLKDVNRAILTANMSLRSEHQDCKGAERLTSYCKERDLFWPLLGAFPAAMENNIAETMRRLSVKNVFLSDEFGDANHVVSTGELIDTAEPWSQKYKLESNKLIMDIFSDSLSVRFAANFESYFTLICGGTELKSIDLESLFEGFWCDTTTRFCWFLNEDEFINPAVSNGPSVGEILEQNTKEYESMTAETNTSEPDGN